MGLREDCIEAGRRAIDDEIGGEMREHLGHVLRKWPNTIQTLSEAALDAFLDTLEGKQNPLVVPNWSWIHQAIAALRDEREEE